MSEDAELLRLANELKPLDLPVGVYIVRRDGQFVSCNHQARKILRLPLEEDVKASSIARFYADPQVREQMHQELQEAEKRGQCLEKLLSFDVGGEEIIVRDYTRSLRDDAGNILGYVCCMTDVTAAERSNRLLDSVPAGVYRLDANDNCETANRAFARILGYDSPSEIDGKPSSEFHVNPAEAARLRHMIEDRHPEPVNNFVAEMRKKDGEKIFVNINAHMVRGDDGAYGGREGTIIDVTFQERYRRILRDVPVGLNFIRHEPEQDVIEDCNEQFLKIFDFPSRDPKVARGFDARKLHASAEEYARFKAELQTKAKQGQPVVGYHLKVKTLTDSFKTVEISSQPLLDADGKMVGRAGAVRDITNEAELRERLDELTHDFGKVLHNYTSTLLMIQLSTEPVIRSLAPDPFLLDEEVTPEQASEAITQPAMELAERLSHLLEFAKEEQRAPALPEEKWTRLNNVLTMLRDYRIEISEIDAQPAVLSEAALEIIEFCNILLPTHRFSRESVLSVGNAARTLVRVTNLISLHQMRDAVLEMDHQVRSLREFVTNNAREPEEREVCGVRSLITQVRSNLFHYARSRRVRVKIEGEDVKVKVARREVLRTLTDLLHNAIKYSWRRDEGKAPWVDIRTRVADGYVYIEFKNWGVPIMQDEIDEGLIFDIGYRGKLSGDRGRVGTGIGLANARRVAHAHRGGVEVTSQPAVASRAKDDYSSPFITCVTMKFPLGQS
ncbi:MAG TPA: PAS domain-containing sensor histidine kinase [Pyrinomonadaceae bacterium]|nr:PAS domain-containing sensor histidine kinase [Pyrinomonadaceae bacterium]